MEQRHCPRCDLDYVGYPALSRVDNKTEICSQCGTEEGILALMAALDKR